MIAAFIADKMNRYIAGGMSAETAAKFAMGELGAIYRGTHYSRDASGALRPTPLLEDIPIEAARAKCNEAIKEILNHYKDEARKQKWEGLAALEYMAKQGIKITPCIKKDDGKYAFKYAYKTEFESLKKENPQVAVSDTSHFTADIETIRKHLADGIENFRFIPADNGLFCLDIDAKEGMENGLKELLKAFDPDTLPDELKDIDRNFPCYVKTPNNGYHLYFRYSGSPIKNTALFPGIETKYGSPGLTSAGSVKDGKPYILHGAIENAPPLFGLILAKIEQANLHKQETKPEPKKAPERAAADRVTPNRPQAWQPKPRIDMDTLAAETSGGNHDRQVQFSGKVCRLQMAARSKGRDYGDFTSGAALSYVKAHPDIFGDGSDTESTVRSVFRDNGGI